MNTAITEHIPAKSRLTLEHAPEQVELDAQKALHWVAERPMRAPFGSEWRAYAATQLPVWTSGYLKAVRERTMELLRDVSVPEAQDARAIILNGISEMMPKCEQYVMGTGPSSKDDGAEGTIALKDPVTGDYLKQYDHKAMQGYMRLAGELTGALDTQGTIKNTGPVMIVTNVPTSTESTPKPVEGVVTKTG